MGKAVKNKIILTSLILFVISYFLPAYYGEFGYNCARYCLLEMWSYQTNFWIILYYFIFNITNIIMIIMPLFILSSYYDRSASQKIKFYLKILFTLLFLHVLSWWFIHFFSDSEIKNIQIGYYLWAFSIGLFVFTIWKNKN
jgi:hypothetical protein